MTEIENKMMAGDFLKFNFPAFGVTRRMGSLAARHMQTGGMIVGRTTRRI